MGGCVCSDSPKMRSGERAEKELRGGLSPGGDCRENVQSVPEDSSCLVSARLVMRLKHA